MAKVYALNVLVVELRVAPTLGGEPLVVVRQLGVVVQSSNSMRLSVMSLERQVTALTNAQGSRTPVNQLTNLTDSPDFSIAIRSEIVEMERQRKRKESMIFSANPNEA